MARIAGRNGALYAGVTSSGAATPIAYCNHWTINFSVDTIDVTAFGDTNKVKVAGLPDASGSYSGFFDTATPQLFAAATDGVSRPTYLYPDRTNSGQYWYGPATFDMSIDDSVDGAVTISGNFSATGAWAKIG